MWPCQPVSVIYLDRPRPSRKHSAAEPPDAGCCVWRHTVRHSLPASAPCLFLRCVWIAPHHCCCCTAFSRQRVRLCTWVVNDIVTTGPCCLLLPFSLWPNSRWTMPTSRLGPADRSHQPGPCCDRSLLTLDSELWRHGVTAWCSWVGNHRRRWVPGHETPKGSREQGMGRGYPPPQSTLGSLGSVVSSPSWVQGKRIFGEFLVVKTRPDNNMHYCII